MITFRSPSDQELSARAWTVCCDFHEDQDQIWAHLMEMADMYGREADGSLIKPPAGWRILPFRAVIPNGPHCEYLLGHGWLHPRRGHSTMTPIWTRPTTHGVRAVAVPL